MVDNGFQNDGIRTYVVGIDIVDAFSPVDPLDGAPDNVNTFDKLNELAGLGDTARGLPSGDFYNASDATVLLTDLSNILTQLMSDSLGGNAKVQMFVNLSPADYNAQESEMSLMYATRIKAVKNSGAADMGMINKLKKQIPQLKSVQAKK